MPRCDGCSKDSLYRFCCLDGSRLRCRGRRSAGSSRASTRPIIGRTASSARCLGYALVAAGGGPLIVPDPRLNEGQFSSEPVLWVSDDPLSDAGSLLARLLMSRAEHGFWPLLLTGPYVPKRYLERMEQPVSPEWMREPGRPWHAGDLVPVPAEAVGDQDPARVLAAWWREVVGGAPDEPLDLGRRGAAEVPFRQWRGLAPASPALGDPDCTAAEICRSAVGVAELTGREEPPYLELVPAGDGAAAIVKCGWLSRAGDTAETAAVIRSWQQRFGARLCLLGIDALADSVAWPPQSAEQALLVAAEHLAFGKDLGIDLSSYASRLRTARVWRFWWD